MGDKPTQSNQADTRPVNKNEYAHLKTLYFNKLQVFSTLHTLNAIVNAIAFSKLTLNHNISYPNLIYLFAAFYIQSNHESKLFTVSMVRVLLHSIMCRATCYLHHARLIELGYIEHVPNLKYKYRITKRTQDILKGFNKLHNNQIERINRKYPNIFS